MAVAVPHKVRHDSHIRSHSTSRGGGSAQVPGKNHTELLPFQSTCMVYVQPTIRTNPGITVAGFGDLHAS